MSKAIVLTLILLTCFILTSCEENHITLRKTALKNLDNKTPETPLEIAKYKDARMATGIKAATYIKDHNLLHAIFEVIQRECAISLPKGNPVKFRENKGY